MTEPVESQALDHGRTLLIVGAGGAARDTLSVVTAINDRSPGTWSLLGFIADQRPTDLKTQLLGHTFVGLESDPGVLDRLLDHWFAVGIGDSHLRGDVTKRLQASGLRVATLVHPDSVIGPEITIGEGSAIYARTVLTVNVRVGRGCQINVASSLSHDVILGDFVTLSPGTTLTGNVTVEDEVFFGAGATVLPGITVGRGARVGAGATVIADVEPFSTVVGVPAKAIKIEKRS